MDTDNGDETPQVGTDDPEIEALFQTVEQLHERIAAVRPDLIVRLDFGDRLKRPGHRTGDDVSFRDQFSNGKDFTNSFAKEGDGFINVHTLDLGPQTPVRE